MSKFVRLWGPLWTHSAFGFESKCGHLKNMFHGKSSVTEQLGFAADVAQTLQLVQQTLEENKSEKTLGFISKMTGQVPRGNMRKIKQHMYAVGNSLSRMYFNGILYHSVRQGTWKEKQYNLYFFHRERKKIWTDSLPTPKKSILLKFWSLSLTHEACFNILDTLADPP